MLIQNEFQERNKVATMLKEFVMHQKDQLRNVESRLTVIYLLIFLIISTWGSIVGTAKQHLPITPLPEGSNFL